MSKGYESSERETRERKPLTLLCEAYACSDVATTIVAGHHYCEAHRPPPGIADRSPETVQNESPHPKAI